MDFAYARKLSSLLMLWNSFGPFHKNLPAVAAVVDVLVFVPLLWRRCPFVVLVSVRACV